VIGPRNGGHEATRRGVVQLLLPAGGGERRGAVRRGSARGRGVGHDDLLLSLLFLSPFPPLDLTNATGLAQAWPES